MTTKQPAKQNAAQKIEALENAFLTQNKQIEILASDIDSLRQVIVSLTKKLNASIQAAETGELSGDSVNKIIMNENMKELEQKISFLVEQGVLVKAQDETVSSSTFVIGREIDLEGNVLNPRVQFAVNSIDMDVQLKFIGNKVGSVVTYAENEPSFEITEVYNIIDPKIKKEYKEETVAP